ncbi:D-aminoacyl-tRNA deacylase [Candidatus Woesearchaeota archaeon]|nr:D-aminoacyl-tRNA deacylase [Candidatus Woesearchaeota archaeon]
MEIALLFSSSDIASMNIQKHILEKGIADVMPNKEYGNFPVRSWTTKCHTIKMYTTEMFSIHCDHIDQEIDPCDAIVFVTKHRSKEEVPAVTVHSPGNWGEALFGGKPASINSPLPRLLRAGLEQLQQQVKQQTKKEIGSPSIAALEATHHGPDIDTPCMFIELGSCEQQWQDPAGGKIVAEALMALLEMDIPEYDIAVGLGGPHYCPNFVKVMEKSDYCFGHICPKYCLKDLTKELLRDAMEKSNATVIILDWKGLGEHKERVVKLLEETKVAYERCDQVMR